MRIVQVKKMLVTAMLCLVLGGCGGWTSDPVVEVIGDVTLDGKVLTDALVVFAPVRFRSDDGKIIPLAFGKTDRTGRFELTAGEQKGVLLGRYRVLFFRPDIAGEVPQLKTDLAKTDLARSGQTLELQQRTASEILGAELAGILNEPKAVIATGGTVPTRYNLYSELEYVVKLPLGIVYPEFPLTSQ